MRANIAVDDKLVREAMKLSDQAVTRCSELAPACQLATDLSPGSRHRLNCRTKKAPSRQPGGGNRACLALVFGVDCLAICR